MSRNPNTATGVGAEAERRATGRYNRGLAAAAAARRAGQVIGIVGTSIDQIVGLDRTSQFRHVGLSEDDPARGTKPGDGRGIGLGNEIRAALGAARADDAGCL